MADTDNNPTPVKPGYILCRLEEMTEAESRVFLLQFDDGEEVEFFIVRRGGAVHAYLNNCPHEDRWLQWEGDSFLTPEGGTILCQAHGATFDIESGQPLTGPALYSGCLTRVPIEIAAGEVRLAPR